MTILPFLVAFVSGTDKQPSKPGATPWPWAVTGAKHHNSINNDQNIISEWEKHYTWMKLGSNSLGAYLFVPRSCKHQLLFQYGAFCLFRIVRCCCPNTDREKLGCLGFWDEGWIKSWRTIKRGVCGLRVGYYEFIEKKVMSKVTWPFSSCIATTHNHCDIWFSW